MEIVAPRMPCRAVLQLNGYGHLSPAGVFDHQLTRYLNGTVESHGARFPLAAYEKMFANRLVWRRRVG